MVNKVQKYVFVGDCNSINLEIIYKSFSYLKNKLEYILIGDIDDLKNYLNLINSKIRVNEIYNPLSFKEYKKNYFNFFNVKKK
jgi:4-hydroxy-L-threonine phosphate dehydrogenase PdxA